MGGGGLIVPMNGACCLDNMTSLVNEYEGGHFRTTMAAQADGKDQMTKKMDADIDHEFVEKMEQVIENNAMGLGLSIGYRVGLIDAMAELKEPKTSMEIAEKSGLNER